jgi:hypothetical protein
MKVHRSIAAAGAAVVLGATAALGLPAVASAHSATYTLKFTVVTNKFVPLTRTTYASQETDVNSTGKTIGFDEGTITFAGNTGTGAVAFVRADGFLYGTLTFTNGGKTLTGKVTGGTGAFNEATGTITGKAITSRKTAVTITYST